MFAPITLQRDHFTPPTEHRLHLRDYLTRQVEHTMIHPTDESLYHLQAVQQRLMVLQSLIYLLVANPDNRRTVITRRTSTEPLTLEQFNDWKEKTTSQLIAKAPVPDEGVTMARAFIVYELNRIIVRD